MLKNEKPQAGRTKNGLQYYLLPQRDFGEKTAAIVIKRGANHIFWREKDGSQTAFPLGTAHFMEHTLFQQEWGDAFAKFMQNGASANAFTDGDKTVYYLTCREGFMENLRLLLDFVQKPFFTKNGTEREKDIICSEIAMYADDADWRAYYQMLGGMYAKHPVKNQIAGTKESVREITAAILQRAYERYYTTENMALVCTGDIPVRRILAAAEGVERRITDACVYFPTEKNQIQEKYQEQKMGLVRPQFQIGYRLPPLPQEKWLERRIAMGFLLELWAGESSRFFGRAYQAELLEEPMGMTYSCGTGYAFAAFSIKGEQPEKTAELLEKERQHLCRRGLEQTNFQRIRRKILGRFLRRLDSPLSLALGQIEWAMYDKTAAEVLERIKTLSQTEAESLLETAFSGDNMVLSVIR